MTMMNTLRNIATVGLALSSIVSPPLAQAHHGWGAYDTDRPVYLEGSVVEVRWQNPHPQLILEVTSAAPKPDSGKIPIPVELDQLGFRQVLADAQAAALGRYTLDLAPIGRLQNWGMSSPPKRGERIVAIAFPSCSDIGTVRPVLVVLANGRPVRQQSVPLPKGCSRDPRG
jgi:hypothetical protein